jgi:hypothetical protein
LDISAAQSDPVNSSTTDQPSLSVIVVSFNGPVLLAGCLASLAHQAREAGAEILVATNWRADGEPLPAALESISSVRWIQAPTGTAVPRLRQLALEQCRAAVVAMTEDDCVPAPDWCRAMIAAHDTADVAIGGAVEPGPYRRGVDWAIYFHDYGRFMLPLPPGRTADLAGNNVSYKRAALAALPKSEDFYDVPIHRTWQREGRLMRADGTLVVHQVNSWTWRDATVGAFHHARGYAGQRFPSRPGWWRAGVGLLALLLPVLATARIIGRVLGSGRHLRALVTALPGVVVYGIFWSIGEAVGYVRGPGTSLAKWR